MKSFDSYVLKKSDKVLILGDFIECLLIIDLFMTFYEGDIHERLDCILNYNVWCYDVRIIKQIEIRWGLPKTFNLYDDDFILSDINEEFDYIVGFPHINYDTPFKNDLHKMWGRYNGFKIPIECWSIIKCLGLLSDGGIFHLGYTIDFSGRKYLGLEQLNLVKNQDLNVKQYDLFYYTYQRKINYGK